jgi:hypothetical protein
VSVLMRRGEAAAGPVPTESDATKPTVTEW